MFLTCLDMFGHVWTCFRCLFKLVIFPLCLQCLSVASQAVEAHAPNKAGAPSRDGASRRLGPGKNRSKKKEEERQE